MSADTNGWRPIATVQQDRTEDILVRFDKAHKPYVKIVDPYHSNLLDQRRDNHIATHWMPVPSPDLTPAAPTPPAPEEGSREEGKSLEQVIEEYFATATREEIDALLKKSNFDFYNKVGRPIFPLDPPPTEISKEAREAAKRTARAISVIDACNQAVGFDRHVFQIEAVSYIQAAIDTVAEPLRREVEELKEQITKLELAADVVGRLSKLVTRDDGIDPEAHHIELTQEEAHLIRTVAEIAERRNVPSVSNTEAERKANPANYCRHNILKGHCPDCL